MKVKIIVAGEGVRCQAWLACPYEGCNHHQPHNARASCILFYQVRHCDKVNGFVTDVSLSEFDSAFSNDPNLAFKAQKEHCH